MRQDLIERMAKRWHGECGWEELTDSGKSQCRAQMNDLLNVVLTAVEEAVKPLREFRDAFPKGQWLEAVVEDVASVKAIDQTLQNVDELKGEK